MYTLPLDVFGAAPAGFAIAALVSSYGLDLRRDRTHRGHGHRSSRVHAGDRGRLVHAADRLRGALVHEVHAMKQWIFRLLGKGPEAVVVTFCSRRSRTLPPHGRRGALAGSRPPPLRRHRRKLAGTAARVEALPHRARARACSPASPTHCAARRTAWPRTKSSPTTRAWSAIICASICPRCSSGAASRSTASTCARGGGPGSGAITPSFRRLSRGRRPRLHSRPPPCRRALALLPLSARARRRGAHL